MAKADLDTKLAGEDAIFRALKEAGWTGNVQSLRLLAHKGEAWRRRNEAECSYAWAGNSEHHKAGTAALAREIAIMAQGFGLHLYLQGDCRGAPVYVDTAPIPENSYNRAHCLYWQCD
jgi:cell wall assembly regulator SMI1